MRRHEPVHAAAMGNFTDAIEPDDVHVYDICPICHDLKSPDHETCIECAARMQAEEQSAKADAHDIPIRDGWHRFYQEMVEWYGWTTRDIIRHMRQVRKERGDPVKPRFRSESSVA